MTDWFDVIYIFLLIGMIIELKWITIFFQASINIWIIFPEIFILLSHVVHRKCNIFVCDTGPIQGAFGQ